MALVHIANFRRILCRVSPDESVRVYKYIPIYSAEVLCGYYQRQSARLF